MIRDDRWFLSLAFLVSMLIVTCGCSGGGSETAEAVPEAGEAAGSVADVGGSVVGMGEMTPEEAREAVQAVLARIDEQDGTADHVVSKCVACALMMDGSAEHRSEYEGYELHFCSEHCRDSFSENADQALLALNVATPEAE